jgi:hypothetical protein
MSEAGGAALQLLALAWVRWFLVLAVAPMLRVGFGARAWSIAAAMAVVLALGDVTLVGADMQPLETVALVVALVAEALLGVVLGVCLSLGAHAVLGAAAVPATLLRLPTGPWLALVASLVLVAGLELGLHHAALRGAGAVQEMFAIGRSVAWLQELDAAATALPRWLAGMTVLGLALATPALLVAAACELGAAAVARGPGAAAALAQAAVATVRLAAVLVALGASWAIDDARWAEAALPHAGAGVERLSARP